MSGTILGLVDKTVTKNRQKSLPSWKRYSRCGCRELYNKTHTYTICQMVISAKNKNTAKEWGGE